MFNEYFPEGLAIQICYFCDKNLKKILEFYDVYQTEIESHKIRAFDFLTGATDRDSEIPNTWAKIIDMIGYIEGGGLVF